MDLIEFGTRLNVGISLSEYLHRFMAENAILYSLLKDNTPSTIGVNLIENGVEYIFINISDVMVNNIQASIGSGSVVTMYGKNILVRCSRAKEVFVINMVNTDCF